MTADAASSTVSAAEVASFERLAAQWWDPDGPMASLHTMNPCRVSYIRATILAHYGGDAASMTPFAGLSVLDAGCGGGLLCEPMARLGANVTGVDAGAAAITAAAEHAKAQGLPITYRQATTTDLVAEDQTFDVVLALEIVEHVADVDAFVVDLESLLKPGGLLIMSTLNRTARSLLGAKIAAEYILRWVPKGAHDWRKFLAPAELAAAVRRTGLRVTGTDGMHFDPLHRRWSVSRDLSINYLLTAEKAH